MKLRIKRKAREVAREKRAADCAHGERFRFVGSLFPRDVELCADCAIDAGALLFADARLHALRQTAMARSEDAPGVDPGSTAALAVFGTPGNPRLLFGPLVTAPPPPGPGEVQGEDAWALYFAEKTRGTAAEVGAAFVLACMPSLAPGFAAVYVSGQSRTRRIDWVVGPKGSTHRITNEDRQHPVFDGLCYGPLDPLFEPRAPTVGRSLGTLIQAARSLLAKKSA